MKLELWQRFWLLFTVIWVVVDGLNVATILAFSEGPIEREKAVQPILYGIGVPIAVYAAAWAWNRFKKKKPSGVRPDGETG